MVLNASLLFLILSLITFVGFAVKAAQVKGHNAFKNLETSFVGRVMQGVFILIILGFWVMIMVNY
ncbi:MAG: hypothetical protein ACP5N2_01700 [Candidatus Nanoarchaeia archaeon]